MDQRVLGQVKCAETKQCHDEDFNDYDRDNLVSKEMLYRSTRSY